MRKTIYNGPNRGLFGVDNFSVYIERYRFRNARPTITRTKSGREIILNCEIRSQGIRITYKSKSKSRTDYLNRDVSVSVSGSREKLSEIEKSILERAERFMLEGDEYYTEGPSMLST